MHMHVDQAGSNPETFRIHDLRTFGRFYPALDSRDATVAQQHVENAIAIAGGIDYVTGFQKKLRHRVASDSRIGSTIE